MVVPAGIEPATRGFSVLCSTDWAIWAIHVCRISAAHQLRGPDLNQRPSGYEPDELPDCSTPRYYLNGGRRIRTFEGVANRFTVCPLWPLGNPTKYIYKTSFTTIIQQWYQMWKPLTGLEPVTCWLQISCSANWATTANILFSNKNGTNRARTCDPLLVRQMLSQLSYDPITKQRSDPDGNRTHDLRRDRAAL